LFRRAATQTTPAAMASTSFSSAGTSTVVQSSLDATIASPVIDNENNQYYFRLNFHLANTEVDLHVRFYGARISYTLGTLAPG
jgi:hypothetical protein